MSYFIHLFFLNARAGNWFWNLYAETGEDYLQIYGVSIIRTLTVSYTI